MNIGDKITESLEEAARGAQRRPGAWDDIDRRIVRRRHRRVIAGSVGVAAAIAAVALIVPRITSNTPAPPIVPGPADTRLTTFQSKLDGFKLSRPSNWSARRNDATDVTTIVPNDVPRVGGKPQFSLDLVLSSGNYRDALIYGRKAPEFQVREGKLKGGYPYVRVERHLAGGNVSVAYHIDWTTPLCPKGADCKRPTQGTVLQATIPAAAPAMWSRYGATAEQSVQSIEAIPRERPAAATVVAKIPVAASKLAVGPDAIWALQRSEMAGNAAKLLRIDPRTNRVVTSINVGVSPTAVVAGTDAVWVVNGSPAGYASPFPSQNSVMRIDPRTNRIVTSIRIQGPQDAAVGRADTLWVTAAESGSKITLLTVDPQTNKISSRLALPGTSEFAHITVGEGPPSDRRDVIWVTTVPVSNGGPDRTLLNRIDTGGKLRTIEIHAGDLTAALTAGFESVWVDVPGTTGANGLARVDVATDRVVASIDLPDGAPIGIGSVTTGEGYVWAVGGRGSMWRVDPVTNARVGNPIYISDNPPAPAGQIVYGFGTLWVPSGDGKIWRLEP